MPFLFTEVLGWDEELLDADVGNKELLDEATRTDLALLGILELLVIIDEVSLFVVDVPNFFKFKIC